MVPEEVAPLQSPEARDQDELARRRAAREEKLRTGQQGNAAAAQDDEGIPHFSWSDIFAMIVAAYQVVFPIVLVFFGAVLALYLLFRLVFARG